MMNIKSFATLVIFLTYSIVAQAASFDCAKAGSEVEHLICGAQELSQLDEELAQAYRQTLSQTNENEYIREWQRYWLSFVREICYDAPCLLDAYRLQIQELNEHAEVLEENGAALSGIYERYYQEMLDSDTAILQLVELKNQRVRLIGKAYWVNDAKIGAVNAGQTAGVFVLKDGNGEYQDAENDVCRFRISLTGDGLGVTDNAPGCGGWNVTFWGEYRKRDDTQASKTSRRFIERTESASNEFDERSLTYPELVNGKNPEQEARINAQIREFIGKTEEPLERALLSRQEIEEFEKEGNPLPYLPYSSSTNAVIHYYDERFLSIEVYSQGYTGGAHGWYFQQGFNYDLQADRRIQLHDLFQEGSAYRAKILHSFFKSLQKEDGPGLNELLFPALEPGEPDFAKEFTMSVLGLKIFLHNVFPHAVGSLVYVEISWEELREYLQHDVYTHFTNME